MVTSFLTGSKKKNKPIIDSPDISKGTISTQPKPNDLFKNIPKGATPSVNNNLIDQPTKQDNFTPIPEKDLLPGYGKDGIGIRFNKDNTVDYTKGGETVKLSKEEYRMLGEQKVKGFSEKGGEITPALLQAQNLKSFKEQQQQALISQIGADNAALLGNNNIGASNINLGQAIGAGLTGAIPGVVGGAAAGAVGGAAIGGIGAIPGAVGGALVGGVGSILNGVRGDIKKQMTEEVSARALSASKIQANLKALVTDTNQNPQNAAANLEMFNYQMALMKQEHAKLKADTNRNLNKWLGADGTRELQRYELFYAPGGQAELLEQRMRIAILSPNANDLFLDNTDLNEYGNI